MFRCMIQEWKKLSYFPYILLSSVGMMILFLMSPAKMDETGKNISIFSFMLSAKETDIKSIEQSALVLWKQGIGEWLILFFPSFSTFPLEDQSFYREMYFGNQIGIYVLKQLTGVFFYGMFASVYGIGATILFRDQYMLLCLPFLLNYMYRQLLTKLLTIAISNSQSIEWIETFYPDSIIRIALKKYWVTSVLLFLVAYMIITILFYWSLKRSIRGGNCGE